MQYIEDMYPIRMIDLEKYFKYTELRKEREKFLAKYTGVCYAEWNIHKKLYQERFSKVYLYLGRGNGKWRQIDDLLDLLEAGRDVTVMNASKAFKKPTQLGYYRYLNDPIKDGLYEEFRKQLITDWTKEYIYPYEFKPMVEPDAYIYRNNYMYNNFLCGDLAFAAFKDASQELVKELEDMK